MPGQARRRSWRQYGDRVLPQAGPASSSAWRTPGQAGASSPCTQHGSPPSCPSTSRWGRPRHGPAQAHLW